MQCVLQRDVVDSESVLIDPESHPKSMASNPSVYFSKAGGIREFCSMPHSAAGFQFTYRRVPGYGQIPLSLEVTADKGE